MEDIKAHETRINDENVILLDTPGLDSNPDPERVFKLLSQWLKEQAK